MTTTHWQSLCCECGYVKRQAARINRYDQTLSCRGCGSYTWHVVVGQNPAEDWREQANYGRYDPIADLRQRWPGWRIECKHLDDCGEAFTLSEKLIELDVDLFNQDWEMSLTHAIGHLYLGHIESGGRELFDDECDAADDAAKILLCPLDPTLRFFTATTRMNSAGGHRGLTKSSSGHRLDAHLASLPPAMFDNGGDARLWPRQALPAHPRTGAIILFARSASPGTARSEARRVRRGQRPGG